MKLASLPLQRIEDNRVFLHCRVVGLAGARTEQPPRAVRGSRGRQAKPRTGIWPPGCPRGLQPLPALLPSTPHTKCVSGFSRGPSLLQVHHALNAFPSSQITRGRNRINMQISLKEPLRSKVSDESLGSSALIQ